MKVLNQKNTGARCCAVTLVAAALAGSLFAADEQRFVSLGYSASPVIQALKAGRQSIDGREMMQSLRSKDKSAAAAPMSSKNMKAAIAAQLRGVDAIVADLSELDLTDHDVLLVEAANDAGIPVVLENVTAEKMAKLFGAGVDNALVVAEFDPRTRKGQLNFAEPMRMIEESPAEAETARTADDRLSFAAKLRFAENIIQARPFTNGVRPQTISDLGNCVANGTSLLPAGACKEWRTSGLGPVYFCPNRGHGTPQYTCSYGMSWYDPEFEFGVYQVDVNKYIRLRAIGGFGMNMANAVRLSSNTERYPWFNQFRVSFTPDFTGTDFSISKLAPANANSTTSFSTTTGWSVSADGSVSSGGPSAGLSVSYNQSATSTMDVTDWSATNNSSGSNASWVYYMSNTKSCTDGAKPIGLYDRLIDKMFSWCTASAKYVVNKVPTFSTDGYAYDKPFAEATWWGHTAASIPVQWKVGVNVNAAWTEYTGWNQYTQTDSRSSYANLYINTGAVSQQVQ